MSDKVSLHISQDDEGSFLFEWIAKDFRVGLSLDNDPEESSWFVVSKESMGDIFEHEPIDCKHLHSLKDSLSLMCLYAVEDFVSRVNEQAERNMAKTGRLEGSHYLAMKKELDALRSANDNNN